MARAGALPTFSIMTTTSPAPSAAPARLGPIDRASRSLGPDLARGFLLLFIALANVWGYLYGRPMSFGFRPADGAVLDRVVDGLTAFLVDDRSRPMFAILYGFGLAAMASRTGQRGLDAKGVRRVLRRRSIGLIALGLLHSALLFSGDILAVYGATGLIGLALVERSATALRRWFAWSFVTSTAVMVALGYLGSLEDVEVEPAATYLAGAGERVVGTALTAGGSALTLLFVPQVVVGIAIHRAGWLRRPWEHRRTLGRVAAWAAVANLVLNLPWALAVARLWSPGQVVQVALFAAHEISGFAMGLGYVCIFAWLAARWRDQPRGPVLTGAAAVGERSLTCYLLQSVLFAPLLSEWGLGWGQWLGTAAAAGLAVGVWLATVLVALALHRAGRRGPFEVVLRRWTYRKAYRRPAAPQGS